MVSRRSLAAGALVVLALAAAGCGSDDGADTASTVAPSTNAAPTVTTPTATAPGPTPTATTPTAATPTATAPATRPGTVESQPGGAGDEQAAVAPATFQIEDDFADPADVAVPAFFTIRVTGVSADGKAHTIGFQGASAKVPAGGKASFDVEGLKAGVYPVTIDGRSGAVTITAGSQPGP